MKKIFSYSVLRFRPSYLLEEQINVGLLFVFKGAHQVVFIYPENLDRVRQFYPKADSNILKKYLQSFEKKARNLSSHAMNLDNVFQTFIPNDANSLYLTSPKSGYYSDINTTLDYYRREYFSIYSNQPTKQSKSGDIALIGVIGIIIYLIWDYFRQENRSSSQDIKEDIQQKFGNLSTDQINNIYNAVEEEVMLNTNYHSNSNSDQDINSIVEKVADKLAKTREFVD